MLALLFTLGDDRYALPTSQVEEVIPLVALRGVPGTPAFVAGLCSYRGRSVPVIDLQVLVCGRPSRRLLSTRIALVCQGAERTELLGVMGEGVTETARLDPGTVRDTGLEAVSARFAGPVAFTDGGEVVQLLRLDDIVPEPLRATLFGPPREVSP